MRDVTYDMAKKQDRPYLQAIFETCFPEDAAELALMLEEWERMELPLPVGRIEGVPRAMLLALPITVRLGLKEYAGRYLYGVATHPDCRRQGLAAELLEYTHRWMRESKEQFSILLPDSDKNRRFYEKCGYRTCGRRAWLPCTDTAAAELPLHKATPEAYATLRRTLCGDAMLWGREGIRLQEKWLQLYGGALWLLGEPEEPWGCAATSTEEDGSTHVRELLCPEHLRGAALHALCRRLGAEKLNCPVMPDAAKRLGIVTAPGAMLFETGTEKMWQGEEIYCALTME